MKNNIILKKIFVIISVILTLAFLLCACGSKVSKKDIMVGTYVNKYEEEIEGDIINIEDSIELKDDMTCVMNFQDTVEGKWDEDGNIYINDMVEHFEINGDKMNYTREDGEKFEFVKVNTSNSSANDKRETNAVENDKDIVIVFTNDIHCGFSDNIGASGLIKYYKDLDNENVYKALVDAGDFSQGDSMGVVSKGESLYKLMNALGYDFVIPGNHDFDYGAKKLIENSLYLSGIIHACNIIDLKTNKPVFNGYKIMTFGNKKVGFVGVTTPRTLTTTAPKNYKDENGNAIFDFSEDGDGTKLYNIVQKNIDEAKNEGADYIILVGHIGEIDALYPYDMKTLIAHVDNVDAAIDGHSHDIYNTKMTRKDGVEIPVAQTGFKLQNIGKLIIGKDGNIKIELINSVNGVDPEVELMVKEMQDKTVEQLSYVIYKDNKINLTVNDKNTGERRIRNGETNLGDFFADAIRNEAKTDIAVVNGGGIRDNILVGDVTYNEILKVAPFFNYINTAYITGQQLLDYLEFNSRVYPEEIGGFVQCSGFTYDIDATKKSNVVEDAEGNFIKVDGEYRVKNVMINGEPIDLSKKYTIAGGSFIIGDPGDGCIMLKDLEMINKEINIDSEILANYFSVADMSKYEKEEGEGRINIIVE